MLYYIVSRTFGGLLTRVAILIPFVRQSGVFVQQVESVGYEVSGVAQCANMDSTVKVGTS